MEMIRMPSRFTHAISKAWIWWTCGWPTTPAAEPIRSPMIPPKAVRGAAAALLDAKAILCQDFPACLSNASKLFEALVSVDGGLWKHELARSAIRGGTAGSRKLMPQLSVSAPYGTDTAFEKRKKAFKAGLADFMEEYDALLGPVAPRPARLHEGTPQSFQFLERVECP